MEVYRVSLKRFLSALAIILVLSLAIAIVSLSVGSAGVSLDLVFKYLLGEASELERILQLRVYRTVAAFLAGSILGVSGVLMQTITRNPLADPYILGLSSAALTVVAIAMLILPQLLALRQYFVLVAFLGAMLGYVLTLTISNLAGGGSLTLVLAGIAVSAFFSGASYIALYAIQKVTGLPFIFLLVGTASFAVSRDVYCLVVPSLACLAVPLIFFKALNAYLYGDDYAKQLGIDPRRTATLAVTMASVGTGATVATLGIVGFVGLATPHISRALVGSDHKYLLPTSFLLGGALTTLADVIVRIVSIGSPYGELPLGVVTSIMGGPFLAYLLMRWYRK